MSRLSEREISELQVLNLITCQDWLIETNNILQFIAILS